MDSVELFFTAVGACVILHCGLKVLTVLKVLFPKVWYPVPSGYFTSMGEWAVVTGASDGIGRAYAIELSKHGMNVAIISRSQEKLNKTAVEIGETTGKRVKVIVADFTKDDVYENIAQNLQDLNIGILVNNVGMLPSPTPCRLLDTDSLEQRINMVINCNVKAMMKMCTIVLPIMERRRKGIILNVSSGLAQIPCPTFSLYTASKVCVNRFSQALQAEYKQKGITIQAVAPFGVSTLLSGYQSPNMFTFTTDQFVRTSLTYVRSGDKTNGSIRHTILGWILDTIPFQLFYSSKLQDRFTEFVKLRVQHMNL
ncbi:17-beta-hydroxysteroid dehydrogenase type 3 isoform X1 [Denticeps clupeoides]|uniref:17-beta-hydroxysteroid dehydrogenase type 3 isoform X1 n=1 Tax=Denticeps clupeoides TaxID=299321 RepID=UPI0010A36857|nr:testosterone 17-beta-dehydrogenase 3 isoform X1 [Denticeps clupeoides]